MKDITELAIFGGIGLFLAVAYHSMRNKQEHEMAEEILSYTSPSQKLRVFRIVSMMSYSELSDTLQMLKAQKAGMTIADPALRVRLAEISRRYQLFT